MICFNLRLGGGLVSVDNNGKVEVNSLQLDKMKVGPNIRLNLMVTFLKSVLDMVTEFLMFWEPVLVLLQARTWIYTLKLTF